MSASAIAYHLRAHKAVDRRLFVDLMGRFERWRSLSNSVYISMGAYPLEDHRLVHRVLGLTKLVAFDLDEMTVARQRFNRPIDSCHCLHMHSGDVVSGLESLLSGCGFDVADGVVVWLDYTDPKEMGVQIREFQTLLDKLNEGDLVRVTVNANPKALMELDSDGKPQYKATTLSKHLDELEKLIGEYLPSGTNELELTKEGFPNVLSRAFSSAALKALPIGGKLTFMPLSIVRYADTTQMLSITGCVMKRGSETATTVCEAMGMAEWPFFSKDWSDIHELVVPTLTLRERLFLERIAIAEEPETVIRDIGFSKAADIDMEAFLASYRKYYRFYPTLLHADL